MAFTGSPAHRRCVQRLATTSVLYAAAVFLDFHVFYHGRIALPAALGLASIPSIPLALMIMSVALYLKEEKDEFQRDLFTRALLWGMGGTLALTSFWSFVHLFARFPPVDGFHVFVLFWVIDGIAAFFLRFRNQVPNE
jgi:hypothetical protein